MIEESTCETPHTFEEAKQYLAQGNSIDYDVVIGRHRGALMTRETWLECVANKSFIDYDGMGNELTDTDFLGVGEKAHGWIYPSESGRIRPETKYILWYNR